MENAYVPSSERLIVIGKRLDTSSNLPCILGSWTKVGILEEVRGRTLGSRKYDGDRYFGDGRKNAGRLMLG